MELSPISRQIWEMKYKHPNDTCIEDTWRRVAKALASVEKNPEEWEDKFYSAMEGFKFIPAGRILSGAGTGRDVTLFNCFVMGTIPDSMEGIFESLKEAALTMQQGGGIGYDFSTLRPKGAPVVGVGADASGPLSFMDVWDAMCRTVMSAGSRRGAMMATMRCDHPDIEEFIDAKRDKNRLRMFNLSVLITDAFMDAVKADADWPLVFKGSVFKTLKAADLWNKIMRATYDYAEPGVIFIDRVNQLNNLSYCETISATNPCGEVPLPPYGACLLGSINLTQFVKSPFTENAEINYDRLDETVSIAIRMLDNVIDVSKFPLPQQEKEAKDKRRIGLGITGLADTLAMLCVKYGSEQSVDFAQSLMYSITLVAQKCSIEIAHEKGNFPLFRDSEFAFTTYDSARIHNLRNSHLTSIAPTGTISLLADNVSSGIEPVFCHTYDRTILQPDGTKNTEEVSGYAYRLYKSIYGDNAPLPDYFVTAQDLTPDQHVKMQAAIQEYIDAAISKTVNVPENISFDDFKDIYTLAYESGCKGCTTYRPNEITGSILTVKKDDQPTQSEQTEQPVAVADTALPVRPEELTGSTYKVRWPDSDHAIYITINDVIDDGSRRPFEVFINSKNTEHYAWTVALTRMISAVFRRGGNVDFVAEELKAVFDPRGGQWMGGKYVPSLLAAIGGVIERHMSGDGSGVDIVVNEPQYDHAQPLGKTCPKCGSPALVKKEGCESCLNCGYSKCG